MPYEFAGAYDAAVLDSNSQLLKNTAFELVTEPGGVLATLYTDRLRTATVAQPFLSDAEGNVHLFTDPGRYRLRQSGSPPGEEITVQPDPDETEGELEAHVIAAVPHPGYLSDTDHDSRDHSVPAGTVVLDDLQDVSVPAPALNDVLTFDGVNWVNAVSAGGLSPAAHDARDHSIVAPSILLQEIGDVSDVPPANGQVPQYSTVLGQYVPSMVAGSGIPPGTAGSVMFYDPTGLTIAQDNLQLFWDDTENQLGVGTNVPTAKAHIVGGTALAGQLQPGDPFLRVEDPSGGFAAIPTGTIVTIAHFNFSNQFRGTGTGGAIELGNLSRSSRIIHFSDTGASFTSRLQLQAHEDAGGAWAPGIKLWETGMVTVGTNADNASPQSVSQAGLAVFAQPTAAGQVPFLQVQELRSIGFPAVLPFYINADAAQSGLLSRWSVGGVPVLEIDQAGNIVPGVAGIKIATASTQMLGFFGAAPVVQRPGVADPAGGLTIDLQARTAINAINANLEALGWQAVA